jgi:hypothetical protein
MGGLGARVEDFCSFPSLDMVAAKVGVAKLSESRLVSYIRNLRISPKETFEEKYKA